MPAITASSNDALSGLLAGRELGHVIDGQLEGEARGRGHAVIDPSTGETIVEMPLGSVEDLDRAVEAARRALPDWRRRTPASRAEALLSLADLVAEHTDLLAQLESLNVGKSVAMSRDEMAIAIDVLRFMAGAVRSMQAPVADEYAEGCLSLVRREPVGVVGAITPWNYPLMTAVWKLAPALAAGNTMVLKPSELTPLTTVVFADLARSVLPDGVLNVVVGVGPVVGQALADHDDVDMVSLTGSVASGISVARLGAGTLKRIHLELGGKAPVVVFDDADLDAVAAAIRDMGFWNAGQECGAATRVLCSTGVHDQLLEKLREAVATLRTGPPGGDGVDVGPLISEAHRQRVDGIVQSAIGEGASAVVGGGAPTEGKGFFYRPTVLADVAEGAAVSQVEIFGPVVTVETFDTEEEAVRRANDSGYGLAASVWTESGRRALRIVEQLGYGTVWVNTHLALATEMPWAGFGKSGSGRELSTYAIDDFSRIKHVMLEKS